MSIRLIARALDRQDVRETAKLVLVGLADHANDAGECWPSIERLRIVASLTHTRHVYAALDKLIAAGLVTRESRPGKRSRFRLCLPATPDASVTPDGGVTPDASVTPPLTEASRVPLTPASLTPDASVTQTVTEPSGEPSVNRHTPAEGGGSVSGASSTPSAKKARRQASPAGGDETFGRFWDAYPRKVAKGAALKAWHRLAPDADLTDAILDALAWQRRLDAWRNPRYIPHPATWLHDRRWEDAPPDAGELRAARWCETFAAAHVEQCRVPYTLSDEDRAAAREITAAVADDLELDALTRLFLLARNDDWDGLQRSPRLLLRNLARLRGHLAAHGGPEGAAARALGEPAPRQHTITVTCSAKRPACGGFAEVLWTEGQPTPRGVCARCRDPRHDVTVAHACRVCGDTHTVSALEAEVQPYACPRLPEGLRHSVARRYHLARVMPEGAATLAADLRAVVPDSPLLADLEAAPHA